MKKKQTAICLIPVLLSLFSCYLWDYEPALFDFPSCIIKTVPKMSEDGVISASLDDSVNYSLFVDKTKSPNCVSFRIAIYLYDGIEWVNCLSNCSSSCTVIEGKTACTNKEETYIAATETDEGWHIEIQFKDLPIGVNQFKVFYQEYYQYKDSIDDELKSNSYLEMPLKIVITE